MRKQKIVVIVGPTASGKSALAVDLARTFRGAVISADSRQVYRGLDIGTGKVTKREMKGVPHYLLDISSLRRAVTAHEFSQKARAAIKTIVKNGSLPIVVGGTGFYIDSLLGRMTLPDVPPNSALRTRLHKKTPAQLYALLKERDPQRARTMDTPSERNNKVRLVRALEIASHAGKKPAATALMLPEDILWIGIRPSLKELEQRIRIRLTARLRLGMIAEAKRLHAQGVSYKRMEALGLEYRSLARLLQNKITRKEFEAELLRDIRRYAKKQLMYWKRNKDIRWYSPKQRKMAERGVAAWLRMR